MALESQQSRGGQAHADADTRLKEADAKLTKIDAQIQELQAGLAASATQQVLDSRLAEADTKLTTLGDQIKELQTGFAGAVSQQLLNSSMEEAAKQVQLMMDNMDARLDQARSEWRSAHSNAQQQQDGLLAQLQSSSQQQAVGINKLEGDIMALRKQADEIVAASSSSSTVGGAELTKLRDQLQSQAEVVNKKLAEADRKLNDVEMKVQQDQQQLATLGARVVACEQGLKDAANNEDIVTLADLKAKLNTVRPAQ